MFKPLSQLSIEEASLKDLAAINKIEKKAHVSPWSEQMLRDSLAGSHHCWKVVRGDQLLGYLIVMQVLQQLELLNIVISPNSQGLGLGSLLLEHLNSFAQSHKIVSTFLEVRQSNMAAIKLYQKFAFKQVGLRKNYYPTKQARENALVMQLNH